MTFPWGGGVWKIAPSQLVHFPVVKLEQVRISGARICICSRTFALKAEFNMAKWLKLDRSSKLTVSVLVSDRNGGGGE